MSAKVYRTELTPISFLRRSASVFPDRTAVVHGERRSTYRQLEDRVDRLVRALHAAGLERGDRVAFLSPNTPAMLEAHYAVPAAGGVLVAVNTRLNSEEVGYILEHSGARFLFVDAELQPTVEPLDLSGLTVVRIDDTGAPGDPYEDRLEAAGPRPAGEPLPESWLDDEEAIILPMFHCNGWCFTWAVTAVAGRHVCLRKVDPARIWELLESEGVTHFNGAPTVHIGVVNDPAAHRLDRPVTITVAGAPPSPTLLGQLGELNFRAVHVYGLTETYGPYTVCDRQDGWDGLPADELAGLLARQGQNYVVADPVRVVTEDMADVPRDGATLGEVCMRGNDVMKGYYDQPEATDEAFRGGWFHSGDIAVMHLDGAIELRDRKKDIIISGGENISTIEVEQAVARHPAVLECAVVAVPDEKWGERPKAFVALKPGASATAEDMITFCRQHLAGFKCPAAVEFTELPKTSTGKIQKFVLRDKEWSGRARRIN